MDNQSEKNLIVKIETEVEEIVKSAGKNYRWSFLTAILIIGLLFSVLSNNLTIGSRWVIPSVITVLLIPFIIAIFLDNHFFARRLSLIMTSVVTIGLIISVIFLATSMFTHTESAYNLFRDALILWSSNVIVFAVWYWEIDQGGPIRRHSSSPDTPDLLFPQMTSELEPWKNWKPSFTDYIFMAFNTSTAFSPTDTLAMSKRVKMLMMTQSSISLIIVAVIAARAINIA